MLPRGASTAARTLTNHDQTVRHPSLFGETHTQQAHKVNGLLAIDDAAA